MFAAARSQLERRGYVFSGRAPDLLLNIAAVVEDRRGLRATPRTIPGSSAVQTEDYRLGRMVIDLIDPRRRQVVWHGTAEGRVSPAMLHDAMAVVKPTMAPVLRGLQDGSRLPHERRVAGLGQTIGQNRQGSAL